MIQAIQPPQWLPTTALPGTEEKIEVMTQRLLAGVPIHHPGDSRWEHVVGCLPKEYGNKGRRQARVEAEIDTEDADDD